MRILRTNLFFFYNCLFLFHTFNRRTWLVVICFWFEKVQQWLARIVFLLPFLFFFSPLGLFCFSLLLLELFFSLFFPLLCFFLLLFCFLFLFLCLSLHLLYSLLLCLFSFLFLLLKLLLLLFFLFLSFLDFNLLQLFKPFFLNFFFGPSNSAVLLFFLLFFIIFYFWIGSFFLLRFLSFVVFMSRSSILFLFIFVCLRLWWSYVFFHLVFFSFHCSWCLFKSCLDSIKVYFLFHKLNIGLMNLAHFSDGLSRFFYTFYEFSVGF